MAKDILIVDDEMDFRLSLAEMFVDFGYRVNTAPSAAQAMDYLLGHPNHLPHLITLDINMPDEDGLTFYQKLRSFQSHIPLIVITGSVPKISTNSGIKALLHKPLDKFELKAVLDYCQL